MRKNLIRFKPHFAGLNKVLGTLERDIMIVLWKRDTPDGHSIFEEIRQTRKVAYTTVLTVISRLVKKGFIKREKKDGIFVYFPAFSRKEFYNYITREVVEGLLNLSSESTIVNFVDVLSELDNKKIRKLYTLIEEKMQQVSRKEKQF